MYDDIMNNFFLIFKNKFSRFCDFIERYGMIFVLTFVILAGIYLRLKLLFSNQSFGFDECALTSNIILKNYSELFKPLDFYQVAPPVFLVAEKFSYVSLSKYFSVEIALRIFPCICSILSLIMLPIFVHKVYRNICVTSGVAFITAFTPNVVNYANEVKQYSFELLIAILLMMFFYFFDVKNFSKIKLFLAGIIISFLPLCSSSAFFIVAIGSLIVLWNIFQNKKSVFYAVVYLIPIFIGTILYTALFYKPVHDALYGFMANYWIDTNPSMFTFENFYLLFTVKTEFFLREFCGIDYPHWGVFFWGNFILFLILKNKKLIVMFLGILGLTVLAGFLNIYPYEARLILFLLPIFSVLYLQSFLFIKNKYVSTFVVITLFVSTLFCLKTPINEYLTHETCIRDVFQKLQEINPELKNVIGIKSCFISYGGKDVVYDLDIWQNFDKYKFKKMLSSMSNDTYYVYLPFRRMSSSYNRDIRDFLMSSDNNVKVVNFYSFDEDDKLFIAEINTSFNGKHK